MHEYEMLILGYKAERKVAADAGLVYNTRKRRARIASKWGREQCKNQR